MESEQLPAVISGSSGVVMHVGVSLHLVDVPAGRKVAIVVSGQEAHAADGLLTFVPNIQTVVVLCVGVHLQNIVDKIRVCAEANGITIL